ncbi:heterokaryon incompatibility protein-domain-containing protein, partial [Lasiosphaeria miniovina]
LPRSLQDAIVVARTLGAPYIWIDALCIVQDDLADWADQAAQMWQIFENSDLTIAAVSARNVFEGFLERPWHQSVKVACERRAADGEGEEEDGQVSRGELALQFPHNSSNSDSLVNSRWNERAWIFQEQILCSRILYFLDELLAMDCLSSQLRTEVPLDHKPRTQRNPWTPKILPKTGTSHVRTRGDDYLDWYALMTFYSGKQLSFPEDKLPAVSGLAHKMLQTHNDTYLAGLWKGDLCRGLMWWPMNNIRAAEYSTYVAPSWSWAAHNGGVTWASQGPTGFRQEMELLDVVVSPAGADPHGRLQSGYLDVVAKTLP